MTVVVTMQGDEQLTRALKEGVRDLEDMTAVHARAARLVEADARPRTPRLTGRLVASLGSQATRDSWQVYADTPYAGAIHYGWRAHNIEPQPFLADAIYAKQTQVEREYELYDEAILQRCEGGPR